MAEFEVLANLPIDFYSSLFRETCLECISITKDAFRQWCEWRDLDRPAFWFGPSPPTPLGIERTKVEEERREPSTTVNADASESDQMDAGIDVTRGNTQKAEPDSSDDAGNQKSKSTNLRRGNPNWKRGSYYKPLRDCLRSRANILKKNEESLCDWFEGLTRREFCELVKPALGGIKLPSDRTLYDSGRKIVAEIENW